MVKQIIILLFPFLIFAQTDSCVANQVLRSVKNEFWETNASFEILFIGTAPVKLWDSFRLPYIDKGNIICNGMIWVSGNEVNDSSYVIVKSSLGYTVQWWKRSSSKNWYLFRKSTKKL